MIRRCAALMVVALLSTLALPAEAAGSRMQFSRDGVAWVPSIDAPLFDPDFRWVPGDAEVRSFWVKNVSSAAELEVSAAGLDNELVTSGDFEVQVRADGGTWQGLDLASSLGAGHLSSGEQRRFDVRVAFSPASTNMSQSARFPLSFIVDLTEAFPSVGPAPGDSAAVTDWLPRTGSSSGLLLVIIGAAGLTTGLLLLVVARRRPVEQDLA